MTSTATLTDPTEPSTTVGRPITTTSLRFTSSDRCDNCGAQAYIGATINGTELLFCRHHGLKSETKLRSLATAWHDETGKLFAEQANRIKE